MKVTDRMINLIAGLLLTVVGIVLFLIVFRVGGAILQSLGELTAPLYWWILGGALLSLLCAFLLYNMAFRMRREEKTIKSQTQFGEIRIAVSAIENLALRATKRVKGVKDVHVGVRADSDALDVFIEISVNPDLNIPQISEEIKAKVDEYIFDTVGIRVNSVKVLVTKVAGENRTRVE